LKWDPIKEEVVCYAEANQRLKPKLWREPWNKLAQVMN
jgi:hypothetical protein